MNACNVVLFVKTSFKCAVWTFKQQLDFKMQEHCRISIVLQRSLFIVPFGIYLILFALLICWVHELYSGKCSKIFRSEKGLCNFCHLAPSHGRTEGMTREQVCILTYLVDFQNMCLDSQSQKHPDPTGVTAERTTGSHNIPITDNVVHSRTFKVRTAYPWKLV